MNEHVPEVKLPALHTGAAVRPIVPQDFEGAWRIASAVVKAGMAPRGLDTPEKAMVAIMHGLEVGFTPMAALQSIAVINSRATVWGDGALALVQASGKMESHKEYVEGTGEARKGVCIVKRKGDPEPKIGEFSVADAKRAKLWGKAGPWTDYSDRMLKMRARAFAMRDGFSDVLKGLGIAEEVSDIPARNGNGNGAPTIDQPAKTIAPPPPVSLPAVNVPGILQELEDNLVTADSPAVVDEVIEALEIPRLFAGNTQALLQASVIKEKHLQRIAGQAHVAEVAAQHAKRKAVAPNCDALEDALGHVHSENPAD